MKQFPMNTNRFVGGTKTPTSLKKLAAISKANGKSVDMTVAYDESMAGESFDIAVKNTTGAAVTLAVAGGLLSTKEEIKAVAGVDVDAIMAHGTISALHTSDGDVVVDCEKLAFLQAYLRSNAVRISEIQMQVNDQKYFKHRLTLNQFDLIASGKEMPIKPTDYVNEANNNTNLIHMFRKDGGEWQLDGTRILCVTIGDGEEVTFSLEFATAVSNGELLANTAQVLGA